MGGIRWKEEDNLTCEISLNPETMGQTTFTIIDDRGNEYQLGTPDYSFYLSAWSGANVLKIGERIVRVGDIVILWYGNKVGLIGNTMIDWRNGRISRVGKTKVCWNGNEISRVGETFVGWRSGKVCRIGRYTLTEE